MSFLIVSCRHPCSSCDFRELILVKQYECWVCNPSFVPDNSMTHNVIKRMLGLQIHRNLEDGTLSILQPVLIASVLE
jgi:hypothetical protein